MPFLTSDLYVYNYKCALIRSETAEMSSSLRHICSSCKQELSRSAYYRHHNTPASCPARQWSELLKKVETESTTCTADIVCVPSCDSEVTSVNHIEIDTQRACVDIENEGSVAENEQNALPCTILLIVLLSPVV